MSIHTIPEITVNGSSTIFGGNVFSARYNVSYESPSEMKLSIISENGKFTINYESYSISQQYCNPYEIYLGSQISFNGYLEDVVEIINPAGNTLELTFVDTSIILDKIQVGLYKRYGLTGNNELIIVGKELNPCEADPYGNPPPIWHDPCHPCINSQADKQQYIDCSEKIKHEILDVVYNFSELIQKLRRFGFLLVGAVDPNPKYTAQYVGSVRDVLNAWCQDFGFFYYWNNGKIIFKDLRNTIDVTTNLENFCPNVLEYRTNYSMKNSVKTATITNFSRPGDPARKYECQEAVYLECQSLKQDTSYSMPLSITPEIDKVAAGLLYYSQTLRDLYYFYVKYQLYNIGKFNDGFQMPELGTIIRSKAITLDSKQSKAAVSIHDAPISSDGGSKAPTNASSINPFSNSAELSSVQSANITKILANEDFYNCIQLFDFETQWKIITKPENYFFYLAEENPTLYNKHVEEESAFADFLNKYAVFVPNPNDSFFEDYDFQLDNLCGGGKTFVNTGTVSYSLTPSNATFINTSGGELAKIGQLPFARFLSVIRDDQSGSTSPNSAIPFKLIIAERGQNPFYPNGAVKSGSGFKAIRDSRILDLAAKFDRCAAQNKNNNKGESIIKLLKVNGKVNLANTNLYLGCSVSQDSFKITQSNSFNNVADFGYNYDGKPLNKVQDPTEQSQEIVYQYPELRCKILGNHSFGGATTLHANKIIFKTPAGSFDYIEPTDALYGVVIEKTKIKKRVINKVESFNITNLGTSINCNYSKILVNSRNISDDRLSVLVKKNDVCEFNTKEIKNIHEQFSKNLSITITRPTISKTFRVPGIDLAGYIPSIDNGLISVEIGIDNSSGVYSIYELGTRLMRLPREEAFKFSNSSVNRVPGSYTNTANYFPLAGQSNV